MGDTSDIWRSHWRIVAVTFALASAVILFAKLADEVLEGDTQRFDSFVRQVIHSGAAPSLTKFMDAVTVLGSTYFLVAASLCAVMGLWTFQQHHRAILLALTMAGGAALLSVLKVVFHRPRPEPFFNDLSPSSYSFPSGHSMMSLCFYGLLAGMLGHSLRKKVWRIVVRIGAALLVLSIGFSRIYLGVHYPTDVLAGYLAALVWIMGALLIDRRLESSVRS
jgi:undecaprenyl-diphosphatase